jgi:hypothetical protein
MVLSGIWREMGHYSMYCFCGSTQHHNASLIIWNWFECRLVLNAVKKLPKDMIAGFYTLEARNPRTGEKIGLDIGESDGKFKAHHLCGL